METTIVYWRYIGVRIGFRVVGFRALGLKTKLSGSK